MLSWYFWGKPRVFGVSLQGVPEFLCHSHQTNLGVCEVLVLGTIADEWTVPLKTVQLSSTSSELCSSASKRLQRSLTNACLLLSCFSLETSNFFSTFLPCGRRTGWMRRLSLLTSLWSVQQSEPHIVLVTLYPVCPSFALWHSQWDASVWSEGAYE